MGRYFVGSIVNKLHRSPLKPSDSSINICDLIINDFITHAHRLAERVKDLIFCFFKLLCQFFLKLLLEPLLKYRRLLAQLGADKLLEIVNRSAIHTRSVARGRGCQSSASSY